jgi:hypothetical protein
MESDDLRTRLAMEPKDISVPPMINTSSRPLEFHEWLPVAASLGQFPNVCMLDCTDIYQLCYKLVVEHRGEAPLLQEASACIKAYERYCSYWG